MIVIQKNRTILKKSKQDEEKFPDTVDNYSGGIQEKCPSYGRPVLVMRDTTERPEGVEAGSIVVSGIDRKGIMLAIDTELMRYKFAKTPENYDVTNVSERVLKIIKEKIDVVNKEIWKK